MGLLAGDIVIVEHVPQNAPTEPKARPALIISTPSFHNGNLDVIILIITSVVRYNSPTDEIIKNDEPYFSQTGLKVTSAVRCGSICSFPKQKIRRKIGVLPRDILERIVNRIIKFLPEFPSKGCDS